MRDSAVIVVGLLLIGGCDRVFVNPTRNAVEQQQDLAHCAATANQLPLRYPNPKLPPGAERKTEAARFVEDCMTAKGYQSQTVR